MRMRTWLTCFTLLAMLSCQFSALAGVCAPLSAVDATARISSPCHSSELEPATADCHADACQPGANAADSAPVLFALIVPAPEQFARVACLGQTVVRDFAPTRFATGPPQVLYGRWLI